MGTLRVWSGRVAALVVGLLAACGGGGGGDGGGGGGGSPRPSVGVSGTIRFNSSFRTAVVESEPNDTLGQSQSVGDVRPGERVAIVGRVDAADDALDGFHLRAASRLRISVTLTHGPAGDLDVLVYDATGAQFVETFQSGAQPETGVFYAKGAFDVVVRATTGASNYELALLADPPPVPLEEAEPNNGPGSANYVGEVVPADVLTLRSTVTLVGDGVDAFLVACPAAVRLTFSLAFPAFQDLDVRVFDATTDLLAPTPLAQFQATTPSPETGVLDVAAGRLLHVEVTTKSAGGLWTLAIAGTSPPVPLRTSLEREAAPPLAPLTAEFRRLRGAPPAAPFGRAPLPAVIGEAVVSLREGQETEGEAEIAARGGRILDRSGPRRRVAFDLPAAEPAEDAARRTVARARAFEGGSATDFAAPNGIRRTLTEPNDPRYPLQWHYEQIRLPEAWDVTTGSASVVVAVIDTGIVHHPDIPTPISGYDFVSDPTNANDGNGRDPDPTDPGDLAYGNYSSFHGTHVAGTIGAITDNGVGVAGVCWKVQLLHVRALGVWGGSDFDIGEAIRYAARLSNISGTLPAQAARVINMSLGGPGTSPTLEAACNAARNAGVLVVASAGNDTSSGFYSPAGYSSVVNVGAVGYTKTLSSFSNFGSTLDLVAPGGEFTDANADGYTDGVLSTLRVEYYFPQNNYDWAHGTSMAAPHVSGVAALVLAVNPALTPAQVQNILQTSAHDLGGTGPDILYGHGLVDAYGAVVLAAGGLPPVAPRLRIEDSFLNFGAIDTTLDAAVTNVGGGTLHVSPPVVEDAASVPWLTASLVTPGDATKDATAVRVTVDRTGLAAGAYFGRVTVTSDGGSKTIQVLMTVVLAPPQIPDISVWVRAIDVESGNVAAETVVNPQTGLSFALGLVVGRYRFVASTDLDRDDTDCEPGEYCGAYPLLSDPLVVDLFVGGVMPDLSFAVNYVSSAAP